jgi:hypothetical protein
MKQLPTLQERITLIQNEIRGVVSQSGVTQWEIQFMKDLQQRDIAFGSPKQNEVLAGIERKVFKEEE